MHKKDIIQLLLGKYYLHAPQHEQATAFAPTNIALCKYWGKRDTELNLPVTSSLSISLGNKGASTTLRLLSEAEDVLILNGSPLETTTRFGKRVVEFLDLFRIQQQPSLRIDINMNIPLAAGLASSACGFASLVAALNKLYGWGLSLQDLSILARLGSGSASRSFWSGFVEWHAGIQADGMDSYSEPFSAAWPELCIGLHVVSHEAKPIPSREAMQRTRETSVLYRSWPEQVQRDLLAIKQAINQQDISALGAAAETNALAMHATMLSAWPPISYSLPATTAAMHAIWQLRSAGLVVYFTQDAGPNLKLLFLKKDIELLSKHFPSLEIIAL
ncbi:MAG: diphosphomevalonate decarboxylase [Gammaproteobacteria bacterium RIFCSPHIGHO2_12_FULL_41_20]|nr:MAG: diphosphomevalonate decarboxylase [Gammaproteobacteria bacterium RIFCSPHIGHO2_12_FULL_41_20]